MEQRARTDDQPPFEQASSAEAPQPQEPFPTPETQPAWSALPPAPPPGSAASKQPFLKRTPVYVAVVLVAVGFGAGIGATAGNAGNAADSTAQAQAQTQTPNTTTTTSAATAPAGTTPAAAPPARAAAAPSVTYACTGSAPDGVDITYGAEGSNNSGGRLPFSKTETLSSTATYFNVTAQLQGGGHVSCSTKVTYTSGGSTQLVTQSASASGGCNIASAEVCSDFTGGWQAC